jgi:NTE family protein
LTSEPLTFDSFKKQIESKHILATCGYPLYLLPWIEIEKGVYCWDGGILSNTPVREVIEASPVNNKNLFIVENYPRQIKELPSNIYDVLHRARDIIFSDKTTHNIKMSRVITRYLRFIDELYHIVERNEEKYKLNQEEFQQITTKYRKFKVERGAEIKKIHYVNREEKLPHMYENIDFSLENIKELIKHGERKTEEMFEKDQIK